VTICSDCKHFRWFGYGHDVPRCAASRTDFVTNGVMSVNTDGRCPKFEAKPMEKKETFGEWLKAALRR
jgi:hypothetical protein